MTNPTTNPPEIVFMPPIPDVPPLENGDRLNRAEFERRYQAMPHLKKAELIEGIVYLTFTVRILQHGSPHAELAACLGVYHAFTPGVLAANSTSIRLDLDNELQPDGLLLIETACGGQTRISLDDFVEGAPELVAEVTVGLESIDLNAKLRAYKRNGVREYVVWRVRDQAIDWFVLRNTQFERLLPTSAGILKSEVFPGLWLDAAAMIRGDLATVLAILQQGIADPAHAAFVAKLQK